MIFSEKQKKNQRIHCWHTCPTGNTKWNTSGWNERTRDKNMNSHEEIRHTIKDNYIGKGESINIVFIILFFSYLT